MEFDAAYALQRYSRHGHGVEYMYYPAQKPKRLLVTFTAMAVPGYYQRIRQFWSPSETWTDTAFLFFRDLDNSWYGNRAPLLEIISSLGIAPIIVCGSCMGAYGAALCGLQLPASAMLLTVPRCPDDTISHALVTASERCPSLPKCYIEARGMWPDQEMLKYITNLYRNRGGLCLFRSLPESQEHCAIDLWKPAFTFSLLDLLESWDTRQ